MTTTGPVDLAAYRDQRTDTARLEAMPSAEDERLAAAFATATPTENRAATIARHPGLAEKLTSPALGYPTASAWNGYIPPRMWAEKLNTSPRRRVLIEICAEAHRRAGGQ